VQYTDKLIAAICSLVFEASCIRLWPMVHTIEEKMPSLLERSEPMQLNVYCGVGRCI